MTRSTLGRSYPTSAQPGVAERRNRLNGALECAHPTPQKFDIVAKAPLLTRLSWTPPVLVGTKLYLRDRKTLMAVELG